MYHLMSNLPVLGTLGVIALLTGPLARLPIDLGPGYSRCCFGGCARPGLVIDTEVAFAQASETWLVHGQGVTIMEARFAGFLIF